MTYFLKHEKLDTIHIDVAQKNVLSQEKYKKNWWIILLVTQFWLKWKWRLAIIKIVVPKVQLKAFIKSFLNNKISRKDTFP